jgi:hypothetical protein
MAENVAWGTLANNQIGRLFVLKETPTFTYNNAKVTQSATTVDNNGSPFPAFAQHDESMTITLNSETFDVDVFYKIKKGASYYWVPITEHTIFEGVPDTATVTAKATTASTTDTVLSPAQFEMNVYTRPVLQIKTGNNKFVNIGLRINNVQQSYMNQFSPAMTNAGWYIHSAGAQLANFSINGFFLDTQTNLEFNDFMRNYQKYLKAYRDNDFYSSAICTFFFKGKQYKCLIAGFSQAQSEMEPLMSKFSLQLIVLKELGFQTSGETLATEPIATSKILAKPGGYYDSLQAMVINPITAYE